VIETRRQRNTAKLIKNLLSNAIKFTEEAGLAWRIEPARGVGARVRNACLPTAGSVMRSRSPTQASAYGGKQRITFPAFQQADGRPVANTAGHGGACRSGRDARV